MREVPAGFFEFFYIAFGELAILGYENQSLSILGRFVG